ncbi:hypothetical protein [Pseudomonas sp. UM16]|uniref:hypothetical protein n=1 Tax=Pseudomonas sp. UM16 TaxID=3158962 RepID=UPI00398FBD89
MLRALKWQEGLVLSIKVEDGVFAIAQMRNNYLLEVFDVFREEDNWEGVDLNRLDVLFTIFVSVKNIKGIFSRLTTGAEIIPNQRPVEKRMLSAIFGAPGNTGARLIELSDDYSSIGAETLKDSLSPKDDLDLIYRYELCGMVGDPEKILSRLKKYRETGVNWDPSKEFLFPGIQLPSR